MIINNNKSCFSVGVAVPAGSWGWWRCRPWRWKRAPGCHTATSGRGWEATPARLSPPPCFIEAKKNQNKSTNTSRNVNICSLTMAIISVAAWLRVPRSPTSHQGSRRNPSEIPLHPPLLNSLSKLLVASWRRLSGFGRQRVPYTAPQRLGRLTGWQLPTLNLR